MAAFAYAHTHFKPAHTHAVAVAWGRGCQWRRGLDKCTLLYLVAESWDASQALQKQHKQQQQLPEKQQQRDGKKHQAKSLQQQECSINDQVIA